MKNSIFIYGINNAFKFILVDKKSFLIKIFGLTISLAISLLIFNYIYFENNFDAFHTKSDRIYRIESNFYDGTELEARWGSSSFGYASAMMENLPGIENFTRIGIHDSKAVVNVAKTNIAFREKNLAYAEPTFFDIFSFELLKGDTKTALNGIGKVIITQSTAKKYFGDTNPIGKSLIFRTPRRKFNCEVSGILNDFPKNSHINFDFLLSYKSLPRWAYETWYLHEAYSYLLLKPETKTQDLISAFPKMSEKYKTQEALRSKTWAIELNPLKEIHLTPQKLYEKEKKGSKTYLNLLFLVGIAILLIALINLINITTASALKRAKEVSIRKVHGSKRNQLFTQFIIEVFIVNVIALLVGLFIVFIIQKPFIAFFDYKIELSLFLLPSFWLKLAIAFIICTFLSGIYPAILLSSFHPISALKGKITHTKSSIGIRKALVVIQFSLTIIIICGVLGISKQIIFMTNHPLGININQKFIIEYPGKTANRKEKVNSFKKEIKEVPGVKHVCVSSTVPGVEAGYFLANRRIEDSNGSQAFEMLAIDDEFLETYQLKLIAGRDFIKDSPADLDRVILNEQGAKKFGYPSAEKAIGSKIILEGETRTCEIIGVVKDFHQQSLKNSFPPLVLFQHDRIGWIPLNSISVAIDEANMSHIMTKINLCWEKHFPENTFDTFFLDKFYAKQYRPEKKLLRILISFAVLSIFVALLGLWSVAIYENSLRIKEIGVRKVNGAKTLEVLLMINKNFLKWVLLAFILSCPIAYFAMNKWLENFAYKTELSWWIFALAGLIAMGIALLTVSFQSWRAATRNPVESLRYE